MKIAILSDRSILNHPFGSLLVESLTNDYHEVTVASADTVNKKVFYDFSKSTRILNSFHELRSPKYRLLSTRYANKFYLGFYVHRLRKLDKLLTKFRAGKMVPLRVYFFSALNAFKLNVDVVIVSRPQTMLAQLILVALQKMKIRKLYFIYYPYELYGQQFHKGKKSVVFLEKYFVKNIYDAIVVPSSARLDYYKSMNPNIRGCVVRNFKKFVPVHRNLPRQLKGLRIVYLGLIDYGRNIETIVDNLGLLPNSCKLILVGEVRQQWLKDNKDSLNHWISSGKLELVAKIPEQMISKQLSMYDIGLISYDDSCLNNRLCAPAKVTDYLHGGLPILAPALPGIKEIVVLNSDIVTYDQSDIRSMFSALVEISSNLSTRSPKKISKSASNLNWRNEYQKFQSLLASLIE